MQRRTWVGAATAVLVALLVLSLSSSAATRFSDVTVRPFVAGDAPKMQWQIVTPGAAAKPGKWQTATGWSSWSFRFNAAGYGHGTRVLLVRLVDGQAELARESVVIHLR